MPTRIAAFGDLHAREGTPRAFRDLFADTCKKADVLLLCGDLTDRGLPQEAEALAEDIHASCTIPVIGILGNHDFESGRQDEVRTILAQGNVKFLENGPYEFQGIGFAGAKGFCGGFDRHLLQPWGEEMMKQFSHESANEAMSLEGHLAKLRTEIRIVLLHYSPIRQTVEGEPLEIYPFLGSSRLAEPIDRFSVTAVFHGHAHNGMAEGKTQKGIPVFNVSLPLLKKLRPAQPFALMTV